MRLNSKFFISVIVVTMLFAGCSNGLKDKDAEVNVMSNLVYLGETLENTYEFKFSLENLSKDAVKLEFRTYLEYNFSLGITDGQYIPSGTIEHEHPSLDSLANANGRTVMLDSQEMIEYQILIKNLPPGKYEISIESASGYGQPIINKKFTIE